MRNLFSLLVLGAAMVALPACSVVMAAKGDGGVEPQKLSRCHTRGCLLAAGATPVSDKTNSQGRRVAETFTAHVPTGSAARAAMHGLLDVSTLGIWEVVGTPIEAVKNKRKNYVLHVTYRHDGNTIKKVNMTF